MVINMMYYISRQATRNSHIMFSDLIVFYFLLLCSLMLMMAASFHCSSDTYGIFIRFLFLSFDCAADRKRERSFFYTLVWIGVVWVNGMGGCGCVCAPEQK